MNTNVIRRGTPCFVTESTEPLKNTVSHVSNLFEIAETNADIALSEDIPRTEVISKKVTMCKNNHRYKYKNKDSNMDSQWRILYPLCNREQIVSKDTFSRLEGKVITTSKCKYRIVYPPQYPVEKYLSIKQVKQTIKDFRAESLIGMLPGIAKIFNQVGNIISLLTSVDTVMTKIKKLTKSMLIRVCSIFTRFVNLVGKNSLDVIPFLCLLADAYALKDDFCNIEPSYEDFSAQGLEDVLLSSVVNMLPDKIKAIALALITVQRRESLFTSSYLQVIVDIVQNTLNMLKEYIKYPFIKSLIQKTQDALVQFSSYSLVSECTNLVLEYQRKPLSLNQPDFWDKIDETYSKLDGLTASSAGFEAADLAKFHPAIKQRIEAFLNLKKLKDQVKNASRVEPSAFIFDGPPGLLKSVTLTKVLTLLDKSVYVHHVKNINDGKDFYDLYANQQVFYMDDVGQQGKSQWRNLINWVSCVPLPLDCATASLKNTKLFNSEIIMLTTNQFMDLQGFTNQDGVADPRALFRRAFVFDWYGLRVRDHLGEPKLEGTIHIKKYNMANGNWEVFNLRNLKGSHTISDEDAFLAWIASWILTISEWKKACKGKNEISQERKAGIQSLIKIAEFDAEVFSIPKHWYENIVPTMPSLSIFSDDHKKQLVPVHGPCEESDSWKWNETSTIDFVHLKDVTPNYLQTMAANLHESDKDVLENTEQILISCHKSLAAAVFEQYHEEGIEDAPYPEHLNDYYIGNAKAFINIAPQNAPLLVNAVKTWDIVDHFKIIASLTFKLIQNALQGILEGIVNFLMCPDDYVCLAIGICYFLLFVNLYVSCSEFEGQTTCDTNSDNWDVIKGLLDTSTFF